LLCSVRFVLVSTMANAVNRSFFVGLNIRRLLCSVRFVLVSTVANAVNR
jgi:hypothetical protein